MSISCQDTPLTSRTRRRGTSFEFHAGSDVFDLGSGNLHNGRTITWWSIFNLPDWSSVTTITLRIVEKASQVTVPDPEPDLQVTALSVSSATAPEAPFTLSATVRNNGDGAAAATTRWERLPLRPPAASRSA